MRLITKKEYRKATTINIAMIKKGYVTFKIGIFSDENGHDTVIKFQEYKSKEFFIPHDNKAKHSYIKNIDTYSVKKWIKMAEMADKQYKKMTRGSWSDNIKPINPVSYYRGLYRYDDSDSGVATLCEKCVSVFEEKHSVDLAFWENPCDDRGVTCEICGDVPSYPLPIDAEQQGVNL